MSSAHPGHQWPQPCASLSPPERAFTPFPLCFCLAPRPPARQTLPQPRPVCCCSQGLAPRARAQTPRASTACRPPRCAMGSRATCPQSAAGLRCRHRTLTWSLPLRYGVVKAGHAAGMRSGVSVSGLPCRAPSSAIKLPAPRAPTTCLSSHARPVPGSCLQWTPHRVSLSTRILAAVRATCSKALVGALQLCASQQACRLAQHISGSCYPIPPCAASHAPPGDSGGPLIFNLGRRRNPLAGRSSDDRLVGSTSWGVGCGLRRLPGVYTHLAGELGEWVERQIAAVRWLWRGRGLGCDWRHAGSRMPGRL
jgi:hypothetical protein